MSAMFRLAAAALCAAPLACAFAQTQTIPTASNPGDAKEIPGQAATPGPPPVVPRPPAPIVDPAKAVDAMISGAEKDIVGLAEAMPAERYDFAPKNSDFTGTLKPNYDGVRTFGQEVAHMAAGNYIYVAMATNNKPAVDPATTSKGTDKATAVAALKASFAAMHQVASTLTPANAFEHAGNGPNSSRITVLVGGIAHQRDHYGQLVEYLRMNGLTPPASAGKPPANPMKM